MALDPCSQNADVSRLRRAVERCIVVLSTGLLKHPKNSGLRERLSDGSLSERQFYQQLQLRLLQVVAWNLGERVGIIPDGSANAKERYLRAYSSHQLCQLEAKNPGADQGGLSQRLQRVLLALWQGDESIALTPCGSTLFDPAYVHDLASFECGDEEIGNLLTTISNEILVNPEPANETSRLDVQILGRVHEWLLELNLVVDYRDWSVFIETVPGHERRATGSYFTPPDLVENLLDLALEPLLDEHIIGFSPEAAQAAILQLRVVDPACGTGVFLIAAARRIASRLDTLGLRTQADQGQNHTTTLTEVILHCLYGVDIGNTAVQLCRLALWFECGPPYRPRTQLEDHIKCGNSMLGAWPALMAEGIPDIAYEPSETDDVEYAKSLKKQNRRERALRLSKATNSRCVEVRRCISGEFDTKAQSRIGDAC